MEIISREEVLAATPAALPTDVVPLASGKAVRVRALTRAESLSLPDNAVEQEAHILALGIVEPTFSVAEIKGWLRSSTAGELQHASRRIAELSGMLEGQAKAAYKSDGDGPDAGV